VDDKKNNSVEKNKKAPFRGQQQPAVRNTKPKISNLATGSASIVPKSDRLRENINSPDRKAAIPNSSTAKIPTRQNQSVKT
jgi:hypothetical protein